MGPFPGSEKIHFMLRQRYSQRMDSLAGLLAVFRFQNLHVRIKWRLLTLLQENRRKKRSHATAEKGGWTARDGRADKQKRPQFSSV